MIREVDIVVIGGGSAGMASAVAAKEAGVDSILVLEGDAELGGILNQCIHNGFGLQIFKEELSGPAFAERYIDQMNEYGIEYQLSSKVSEITADRKVTYVNPCGVFEVQAKKIILACGCSERTRGAISIPGTRVKGVYTAGTAQKYANIENILVGKKVFILGSGDIGLIMARRMTLEGAKVLGVAELMPYSNGLMRNIVQCLEDFDIPLYLSHTVTEIIGEDKLEKIKIQEVDENRNPIQGTEKEFEVDTLLLSVGLIPENVLAYAVGVKLDPITRGAVVNERLETSVPGIYACGNALHVHDLVDFVAIESGQAGKNAAADLMSVQKDRDEKPTVAGEGVGYIVPQKFDKNNLEEVTFSFRVRKPSQKSVIEFLDGETVIKTKQKNFLLPAEMERIPLKPELLSAVKENLTIRVREYCEK